MPPSSKFSPYEIRKRLAEVMRELETVSPELMAEMKSLEQLLAVAEHGQQPLFSKVRTVIGAIELCFDLRKEWMTKQQLFQMISAGGFVLDPATGKYLISDALKYHTGRGRVAKKGELYGRPDWLEGSAE